MTDDVVQALNSLNGTAEAQLRITLLIAGHLHLAGVLDGSVLAAEVDEIAETSAASGVRVLALAAVKLDAAARLLEQAARIWEKDRKRLLQSRSARSGGRSGRARRGR